jgi:hypothetical protein
MNFPHDIIFKALVGSQAYGTATPTSDQDYKGIYVQKDRDLLTFNYQPQIEVSKDETYYEIRRVVELLRTGNPTLLELLYSPKDCIVYKSPAMQVLIDNRDKFLTKRCKETFAGYAMAQIKKAKGTDKLMNWEAERMERKDVLDFCYVYDNGKTVPLKAFLSKRMLNQKYCGLAALDHFRDGYALYYDFNGEGVDEAIENNWIDQLPDADIKEGRLGYKGIIGEKSNEVRLSSIPKGEEPIGIMHFNKDGYSVHCKDYSRFLEWKEKHNKQRLVDVKNHNQKIDGKNMLHCRRLLDVAYEIATQKKIIVRRPDAAELLAIRRGEVDLQTLIYEAEQMIEDMGLAYEHSNLPEEVDLWFCNELIMEIRDQTKKWHKSLK